MGSFNPLPPSSSSPLSNLPGMRAVSGPRKGYAKLDPVSESGNVDKFKDEQLRLIGSGKPFPKMSREFMRNLKEQAPNEFAAIMKFKRKHKKTAKRVRKLGWNKLKKDLGRDMRKPNGKLHPISLDEFRKQSVDQVIKLCLAAVKEMGYDPPGHHNDTGTPGYASDIDTVYFPPEGGIPEEVQVFEKLAFDMIMLDVFGGLPGELFDTESYLNHAGAACNTETKMQTEAGRAKFARVELNASSLQTLIQLGGPDSEKWDSYKQTQLEGLEAGSPEYQALSNSFNDVECLQRDINEGVEAQVEVQMLIDNRGIDDEQAKILVKDPVFASRRKALCAEVEADHPNARQKAKKYAVMTYKAAGMMELSRQMDDCKAILDKKKIAQSEALERGLDIPENEKEAMDALECKLANLATVRTRFCDEGYNSQGSFIHICFNKGGQIHQRKLEKQDRRNRMRAAIRNIGRVSLEEKVAIKSIVVGRLELDKLKTRRQSIGKIEKEVRNLSKERRDAELREVEKRIPNVKSVVRNYQKAETKIDIEKSVLIREEESKTPRKRSTSPIRLMRQSFSDWQHLRRVENEFKRFRRVSSPRRGAITTLGLKDDPHFQAPSSITTPQQHSSSALENLSMYLGHYDHKTGEGTNEECQKALIATSKYSERTMDSNLALLRFIGENRGGGPEDHVFNSLKKKAHELYSHCADQEKLKRGTFLNPTYTKNVLLETLGKGKSLHEFEELEDNINKMIAKTEKWAINEEDRRLEKSDRSLNKSQTREHMFSMLILELVANGYVQADSTLDEEGLQKSKNSKVNALMKGLCGWPENLRDTELKGLFKEAEVETLLGDEHWSSRRSMEKPQADTDTVSEAGSFESKKSINLTTANGIDSFNQEIRDLTIEIYHLSLREGTISRPEAESDDSMSLRSLWQSSMVTANAVDRRPFNDLRGDL